MNHCFNVSNHLLILSNVLQIKRQCSTFSLKELTSISSAIELAIRSNRKSILLIGQKVLFNHAFNKAISFFLFGFYIISASDNRTYVDIADCKVAYTLGRKEELLPVCGFRSLIPSFTRSRTVQYDTFV